MQILAGLQASFLRILGDVLLKVPELFFGPHQMIEAFLLPETAALSECFVDFSGREAFPGFTLLQQTLIINKRTQQMDVVGHDDKVGQEVLLTVGVFQTCADDLCERRLSQDARSVAVIKTRMPLEGKRAIEILLLVAGQFRKTLSPVGSERVDRVLT